MDVIIIVGVVGRRFASWIGSMCTQCLTPVSLWHFLSVGMLEEGLRRSYLADGFGNTARPENAHLDAGQLTKHCFLEISLCKLVFYFIIILLKKLKKK